MRIIIEIDDKHLKSYSDGEDDAKVTTKYSPAEERTVPAIDGGAAAAMVESPAGNEGRLESYDEPTTIVDSGSAEDAGTAPDV